jgi:gluconate 2-dehydrogenase alpha chain
MARKLPSQDAMVIGLGWTGRSLHTSWQKPVSMSWRSNGALARYRLGFSTVLRSERVALRHQARSVLPSRIGDADVPQQRRPDGAADAQFFQLSAGQWRRRRGVHWNGLTWRFLPTVFRLRSHLEEFYGKAVLPNDVTIQDWPLGYDELEPCYDRFEKLCGTSGKAGNIRG